jgi:hypothetical protein
MKKFAFFAAIALLTSTASDTYAYYYAKPNAPLTAQNDTAPNLYDRNRTNYNSNAQVNQAQAQGNPANQGGYRSSYYYQDNYYRYNSNPTNVNPDYNAITPNYSGSNTPTYNWDNANSPYRGDYQGAYEYRSPY